MGMSTHIVERLPEETADYFGSEWPELNKLEEKLEVDIPYHNYSKNMTEGFEIIVSEIPNGVFKIRFTNTWKQKAHYIVTL